jgi:hypothetical protein
MPLKPSVSRRATRWRTRCIGPTDRAHSTTRAEKRTAPAKKPTKELNKLGDAFIHVGLDRLLSLSAQYKGK